MIKVYLGKRRGKKEKHVKVVYCFHKKLGYG